MEALYAAAIMTGNIAHRDGKSATPCLDKNCLELIGANDGQALLILKGWAQGWHSANAAELVAGPVAL